MSRKYRKEENRLTPFVAVNWYFKKIGEMRYGKKLLHKLLRKQNKKEIKIQLEEME